MMNDKNQNTNAPEVHRILPVMLKVENLHIHLDERSTSNTYFNGVEDQDEEPDIDIRGHDRHHLHQDRSVQGCRRDGSGRSG